MNPGEYLPAEGDIAANLGRETRTLSVTNLGDRPIQVGSHYHFAEANPALQFDRAAARGFRLDLPAGTSARFEPGIERTVDPNGIRPERRDVEHGAGFSRDRDDRGDSPE